MEIQSPANYSLIAGVLKNDDVIQKTWKQLCATWSIPCLTLSTICDINITYFFCVRASIPKGIQKEHFSLPSRWARMNKALLRLIWIYSAAVKNFCLGCKRLELHILVRRTGLHIFARRLSSVNKVVVQDDMRRRIGNVRNSDPSCLKLRSPDASKAVKLAVWTQPNLEQRNWKELSNDYDFNSEKVFYRLHTIVTF